MKKKGLLAFSLLAAALSGINAAFALMAPLTPLNGLYALGVALGFWLTNDVLKERRRQIRAEEQKERSEEEQRERSDV